MRDLQCNAVRAYLHAEDSGTILDCNFLKIHAMPFQPFPDKQVMRPSTWTKICLFLTPAELLLKSDLSLTLG